MPHATRLDSTDALDAIEMYFTRGFTDGLPVVPPTPERVADFLHVAGLEPDTVLGVEQVRNRPLTAEKVAINAVMAGCLPAYFPVVVAVVQAICKPEFTLHGSSSSTGGSAPLIVVNGPIRKALGMNATGNVLANGTRANATIGRTIRLIQMNVLGYVPGGLDCSTYGHPGKFTLCIAEDEEDSAWEPLFTERTGIAGNGVTVMACESGHQIMNEWTTDPTEILATYAAAMRANMLHYSIWSGNYALIVGKQLRDLIVAAGWSKDDVRNYIFEHARVKWGDWAKVGKQAVVSRNDPEKVMRALGSPEDLLVVAAGGAAGGFGMIFPPWVGHRSKAVSHPIVNGA